MRKSTDNIISKQNEKHPCSGFSLVGAILSKSDHNF